MIASEIASENGVKMKAYFEIHKKQLQNIECIRLSHILFISIEIPSLFNL